MKTKLVVGLLSALVIVTGCVKTVDGRKTAGVPWVKDKVSGHYERSLDQVYDAAKEVLKTNGTLINEKILHSSTNEVKTIEGKVDQRTVYVRVESVEPKVTAVEVQTRTSGGVADVQLAHDVEKQIALKLSR